MSTLKLQDLGGMGTLKKQYHSSSYNVHIVETEHKKKSVGSTTETLQLRGIECNFLNTLETSVKYISSDLSSVALFTIAIASLTVNQFSQFLAHKHIMEFATRRYIVSPTSTVCVTAIPCKNLDHNFIDI